MCTPPLRLSIGLVAAVLLLLAWPAHADFAEDFIARFPAARGARMAVAWPGFHSVVRGEEVVFVKDDLSILINGEVIDLGAGASLTRQLREAGRQPIDVAQFDLRDAIAFGHGPATLYVFSDPDCPYCQQLEPALERLENTRVYVFPFPLVGLHPGAAQVAESIWCADDPALAWRAYVLHGLRPLPALCDNPIERNLALGEQLHILGTPAIIFEDGTLVPGAIPLERIQAQLAASQQRQPAEEAP